MNMIFALMLLVALGLWIAYAFRKRENEPELAEDLGYTVADLIIFSKRVISRSISGKEQAVDSLDVKRLKEQRKRLRRAVRHSIHGIKENKEYVKSFLREKMTLAYEFTREMLNVFIPFDTPESLTAMDKFDIVLFKLKQTHGNQAFNYLVREYKWNVPRGIYQGAKTVKEDGTIEYKEIGYVVREDMIEQVYSAESQKFELTVDDMIDILVQRVYQSFLGLGPLDELYEQSIDGIRGGTRGIPESVAVDFQVQDFYGNWINPPRDFDACTVFHKGISLNMEFMSFGSSLELRRICENVYTYKAPYQLNRRRGFVVSQLADNSRVVVVSPEFAESFGFFIRKFDGGLVDIKTLFEGQGNAEMMVEWMDLFAKGGIFTIFTGAQGSGKTTMMRAAIAYFYHWWALRIQDGSAFELWIRKSFYWRDGMAFRETDNISSLEGLVLQKKTDGTANLVAEAADAEQFSNAIETSGVGSLFSWTTHHANTPEALMDAGVDSLIRVGLQVDPGRAERYLVGRLKANPHLVNELGNRYMERFTEFIPLNIEPYPNTYKAAASMEELVASKIELDAEYYRRTTDRKYYTHQNIFEYRKGAYVAVNKPSADLISKMKKNMIEADRVRLDQFIAKTPWEKVS